MFSIFLEWQLMTLSQLKAKTKVGGRLIFMIFKCTSNKKKMYINLKDNEKILDDY